jgi:hypothetical protein
MSPNEEKFVTALQAIERAEEAYRQAFDARLTCERLVVRARYMALNVFSDDSSNSDEVLQAFEKSLIKARDMEHSAHEQHVHALRLFDTMSMKAGKK